METALAQIATWCDTASSPDMNYFAYKLREYLLARAGDDDGNAVEFMAEMVEFLEEE
jgi:hypothetical protein